MKIYIHRTTGVATAKIGDTSPLQSIQAILGATLNLDCVFHDGANAVELAGDATGVCVAKQDKHYADAALVQALAWTKASATADGYRFVLQPAGDAIVALLDNLESIQLMLQIAWTEGGARSLTQKISFPIANAVYRENEPEIEQPGQIWPLPGELALKTDLVGFSGEVVIGDHIAAFENGLIKTIVPKTI